MVSKEQNLAKQPMGLQRVEQARALLVQAKTLDEVKDLHDQAKAMTTYLKERGIAGEAHLDAWEVLQLTNRRLGEMCSGLEKVPSGRKKKAGLSNGELRVSKTKQLELYKISKMQASRWERLAALSAKDFAAWLQQGRARLFKSSDVDAGKAASKVPDSHDSDSYGTPADIVELERQVLGEIGLDPASNAEAQKIVSAKKFWTKRDDCLERAWKASTVHLNPPYSHPLVQKVVAKFVAEYDAKHFAAGIVLVNNATETDWFQLLLGQGYPVCFPKKRISFLVGGVPMTQNRQAQAFFCAGNARVRAKFVEVFSTIGQCR